MPDLALRELATEDRRTGCGLGNTSLSAVLHSARSSGSQIRPEVHFIVFRSRYKSNCDARKLVLSRTCKMCGC
jgi:hypothetical protein